jgi:MFS family permease
MSVSLLVGSRLGDLFGRRRVLLAGMGAFVTASLLCSLAPSATALVVLRGLQGVTGAVMIPQGFGLVRELFGAEGQQRAFGVIGPIMGLAAVLGPIVGGGLVSADVLGTGWRAIFLINVPVGLAALAVGRRYLPRIGPTAAGGRVDAVSVSLATVGGVALIYPLIEGRAHGWPAWAFAMLASGVVLLAAFAVRQGRRARRGHTPLVEPSILGRRAYLAGLAVVVGFIGAMGGMTIALNVMWQAGLGMTPLDSSFATAAIPVAAIAGSITSSVLLARMGRMTMHIGIAVMASGLALTTGVLVLAGASLTTWDLVAPLAVTGYGMGMVFVPMFDVILASVAPHEIGSATGLLESVQQLAMSVGIAVVGTVLFNRLGSGHGALAFVRATEPALLVAIAFLGAAWVAVCWLPRHARAAAHA